MRRLTFFYTALIIAGLLGLQAAQNVCNAAPQPFGAGNLVVQKFEQDNTIAANSAYYAAPMVIEEYKIETDGNLTLVQSFKLPETTVGTDRRIFGIPRSLFSGTMTLSNDGQYLITYGYDVAKGDNLPYNTPASMAGKPIVFARIAYDGSVNTSTTFGSFRQEISGVTSYDGSKFYYAGNLSTAAGNRGLQYIELGTSTEKTIMNSTDMAAIGGIRTIFYSNDFFILNSFNKSFNVSNATMPPTTVSTFNEIIPAQTGYSSYSTCIIDTDPENPGTKLVMYQPSDNTGVHKYSLVGGTWVSNGKCLTSLAATTTTFLKSITGRKVADGVELYIVENDKYNGRLVRFKDVTGYNQAINETNADASLTVLQDLTGTDYAIRSLAWAPEQIDPGPGTSNNIKQKENDLYKVFINNGVAHVENLGVSTNIEIYNVVGKKLLDRKLQNGLNEFPELKRGGVLIFSIDGYTYKVIL